MAPPGWDDGDEPTSESTLETYQPSTTVADEINAMVKEISSELTLVHKGAYDEKRAVKAAALALNTQLKLSSILTETEAIAKTVKNQIKRVEGEVYFEAKENSDKKLTDVALSQLIAKSNKTCIAKSNAVQAEKQAKEWESIANILKDAHIFFRNLGKSDWS